MDEKAQGSSNLFLYLLFFMFMIFILTTGLGQTLGIAFGYVLEPLIGFNYEYPLITLFLAGIIVVLLSSFFTNLFTDWIKMGKAQEANKAFQNEMKKARKEGNTNRVNKLMKMQPKIMKKQTEASSSMMKPMLFLFIFIIPIFMWLRAFLEDLPLEGYYFFTVPWATHISFFGKTVMQNWLLLYFVFSIVIGQIIRQGLKYISISDWWKNIKPDIKPFK